MQIILLDNVVDLADLDEVVKVKNGYARDKPLWTPGCSAPSPTTTSRPS